MVPIVTLLNGDSIELMHGQDLALRPIEGRIFKADAVVCDPPYGFNFAGGTVKIEGKTLSQDPGWDDFKQTSARRNAMNDAEEFARFSERWMRATQNLLWPGGHVLAFTASKTLDLLGRGMRLANLDIVRPLAWFYGAQGQVKSVTDLRPGYEPLLLSRYLDQIMIGRFLGEMGGLDDLRIYFKQTGRGLLHTETWKAEDGQHPTDVVVSIDPEENDEILAAIEQHAAAFYVAKPTAKDRDWGCGDLPLMVKHSRLSHMSSNITGKVVKEVRAQNFHPTVKPIALMRRLIRLVSRPGHVILDPFMGSGTCGVAAVQEGRHYIGIELDPDYFKIAETRIRSALAEMTA